MRDQGVLTQAELEAQKRQILVSHGLTTAGRHIWSAAEWYADKLLGPQRLGPGDLDLSVRSNQCGSNLAVGRGPEQQEVRMAARVSPLDPGGSSNGSAASRAAASANGAAPASSNGPRRFARRGMGETSRMFAVATDEQDNGTPVISVMGEVDLATVPALEEALLRFKEIATLRMVEVELPPDRETDFEGAAQAARERGMDRLGERLDPDGRPG